MKSLSKKISLLLSAIIVFSVFSILGVSTAALTVDDADFEIGDFLEYDIDLQTPINLVNGQLEITYSNNLRLVKLAEDLSANFPSVYDSIIYNTAIAGSIKFNFSNASNPYTSYTANTNQLANFTFEVIAGGDIEITENIVYIGGETAASSTVDSVPLIEKNVVASTGAGTVVATSVKQVQAPIEPPTDPTDPSEAPTDPTVPTDPTDPTVPTEPTPSPTDPTDGVDEINQTELAANASANSEQSPAQGNDGDASMAFNKSIDSWWHSRWTGTAPTGEVASGVASPSNPIYIQTSWDTSRSINNLSYLGRTDVPKNWIADYEIYVANVSNPTDEDFYFVASGTMDSPLTNFGTTVKFAEVNATAIRLVATSVYISDPTYTSTTIGNGYVTASDIHVYYVLPDAQAYIVDTVADENGTTSDRIITNYANKTATVTAIADLGYEFAGWYSDAEYTTLVSNASTYSFEPDTHTTLYAKFDVKSAGFDYGDVNIDGEINAKDAILVLQRYANIIDGNTNFNAVNADVNKDNAITSDDAILILQYYAYIIENF